MNDGFAACSAAVFDSDEQCLLAARFESMATGHAEAIAPMVQETMQAAGLEYGSLHRIAVTIGPGTFTGLRIGLAFAPDGRLDVYSLEIRHWSQLLALLPALALLGTMAPAEARDAAPRFQTLPPGSASLA